MKFEILHIATKVGEFEYQNVGSNNIMLLLNNGARVLLNAQWWDKDSVSKSIESNIDYISNEYDKYEEKRNKPHYNNTEDVKEELKRMDDFFKDNYDEYDYAMTTATINNLLGIIDDLESEDDD